MAVPVPPTTPVVVNFDRGELTLRSNHSGTSILQRRFHTMRPGSTTWFSTDTANTNPFTYDFVSWPEPGTFRANAAVRNADGWSTPSGELVVTIPDYPTTGPTISLTSHTNNSIRVQGTATSVGGSGGVTKRWYVNWAEAVNYPDNGTLTGREEADGDITITGLKPGVEYFVWLRNMNQLGLSPYSTSIRVKLHDIPLAPDAPTLSYAAGVPSPAGAAVRTVWTDNGTGQGTSALSLTERRVGYSTSSTATAPTTSVAVADYDETFTGLTPNTTYWFWTRVSNAYGASPWSARSVGILTRSLPPTPDVPVLSDATGTSIRAVWADNGAGSGSTILERRVGYGTSSTAPTSYLTPADGDDTITGLTTGTRYYFWTQVRNEQGWSPLSASATAVTLGGPPSPNAPTLSHIQGGTTIRVVWTDNSGGDAPIINRRIGYGKVATAPEAYFGPPADGDDNVTVASANTLYYFWTQVETSVGWSPLSPASSITTLNLPPAPDAPVLASRTGTTATLTWTDNGAGASPILERRVAYGTSSTALTSYFTPADGNDTITGLAINTTYYFAVQVRNTQGWSPLSPVISGKTHGLPPAPNLATISSVTDRSFIATWTDNGGGDSEILERRVGYGTSTTAPVSYFTPADGVDQITGLTSGDVYYVWTQVRNAQGWSPLSPRTNQITIHTVPKQTTTPNVTSFKHDSATMTFTAGGNGGSPILDMRIGYSKASVNPTAPTYYHENADGTDTVPDLEQGETYYFWAQARNIYGYGPLSARSEPVTLKTLPPAPNAPSIFGVTQTTMELTWTDNGNGGSPIIERILAYGTSSSVLDATGIASDGDDTLTGLSAGTVYYFWTRVRTELGWSTYSPRISQQTAAGAWVNVNGVWKAAVPYVNVQGVWKLVKPHTKIAGVWKEDA